MKSSGIMQRFPAIDDTKKSSLIYSPSKCRPFASAYSRVSQIQRKLSTEILGEDEENEEECH